ncbi:MAG: SurA N-terminal domain-containing protein [Aquificaceae bacterium]|nr:SurA N-terminal domain-containing protein [Aquificaceae bacterium]MDW8237889.1 SurA N-terminal domain-containing protein [Aquificaceae bacterium]
MYSLIHRYKTFTISVVAIASGAFFLWTFASSESGLLPGQSSSCVAYVNGHCISVRDFRRESMRFEGLILDEELQKKQVIDNLITQELLYQKARSLLLTASDKEIVELIKSDPSFQEGGQFSKSRYEQVVARLGMTPREYEEYLRKVITAQKLITLISNAVYISPEEERLNLLLHETKIKGELYLIDELSVIELYEPSEKELEELYRLNKESFKKPPGRNLKLWRVKSKESALEIYQKLKKGEVPAGFETFDLTKQNNFSQSIQDALIRLKDKEPDVVKDAGDFVVLFAESSKQEGYMSIQEVKERLKLVAFEKNAQELIKKAADKTLQDLKQNKKPDIKPLELNNVFLSDLGSVYGLDISVLEKILKSDEKIFGPFKARNGLAVLSLSSKIKEPLPQKDKEALLEDLRSLKAQALLSSYIESLRKSASISGGER